MANSQAKKQNVGHLLMSADKLRTEQVPIRQRKSLRTELVAAPRAKNAQMRNYLRSRCVEARISWIAEHANTSGDRGLARCPSALAGRAIPGMRVLVIRMRGVK